MDRLIAAVVTLLAMDIQANEPKAARSVHLFYTAPAGTLFYNEVTVEVSAPGTYFMACGWNTGYFGIQELRGPEDKIVLFSVWDPTKGDHPDAVAAEQRVEVIFQGEGVTVSRFGGEGTGAKSVFPYPWKVGERNRFFVSAEVDGEKTTYTANFFLPGEKRWKKLASFRAVTKGSPLQGYYSFVEDFRRDGKSPTELRRARFGHGWIRRTSGEWFELTRALFTADDNPLMNIDAGLTGDDFHLATGSEIAPSHPLKTELQRAASGTHPDVER